MDLIITHYSKCSPEKDRWRIVPFVSREIGKPNGPFYFGCETEIPFSFQQILDREQGGGLIRIKSLTFNRDKALWLTPDGEVLLASRSDPIGDSSRFLVGFIDLIPNPANINRPNKPIRRAIQERRGSSQIVWVNEGYLKTEIYKELYLAILDNLQQMTQATSRIQLPPGSIQWDLLASFINENQFDFCCDPYFKTVPRSRLVEIIQFGWLKSFKCVVNGRSNLYFADAILKQQHRPFKERLLEVLLTSTEDIRIGILGETAAGLEVVRILSPFPNFSKRVLASISPEHLRWWLNQDSERRFAVCDNQVATTIEDMTDEYHAKHFPPPANNILFHYTSEDRIGHFEQPIPVGFMYPVGDAEWGLMLREAFANAIIQLLNNENQWVDDAGQPSLSAELKTIGVETLPWIELRQSLGLSEGELKKSTVQTLKSEIATKVN